LRKQLLEIREINRKFTDQGTDFRLLTGSEVDILSEGKMDFDDDLLAELDVVIASIHQGFSQKRSRNDEALIRAAENPYVKIMGHLTDACSWRASLTR